MQQSLTRQPRCSCRRCWPRQPYEMPSCVHRESAWQHPRPAHVPAVTTMVRLALWPVTRVNAGGEADAGGPKRANPTPPFPLGPSILQAPAVMLPLKRAGDRTHFISPERAIDVFTEAQCQNGAFETADSCHGAATEPPSRREVLAALQSMLCYRSKTKLLI